MQVYEYVRVKKKKAINHYVDSITSSLYAIFHPFRTLPNFQISKRGPARGDDRQSGHSQALS